MPGTNATHALTPEELMAYLDGESAAESRAAIETHLAGCRECQQIAADLRGVSAQSALWNVDAAPPTLRAPRVHRPRAWQLPAFSWRPAYLAVALGGVAATLLLVTNLVPYAKRMRATDARSVMNEHVVNAKGALPNKQAVVRQGDAVDGFAPRGRGFGDRAAGGGGGNTRGVTAESGEVLAAKAVARPAQSVTPDQPRRSLIRTATLRIVARDFEKTRPAVEKLASDTGGFIDEMTAAGSPGTTRVLTGTLRVPSNRLGEALARLRQLGQVVEDTQGAEDVTDQLVDLDARLANARATEQRLTDILKNRTGRLSDVLAVERELARVRLEIERMDAERANIGRRVTYAAIAIEISEERKAGLGPLSLTTRLRVAAVDGLESAFESVVGTVLFVLRAGPATLLWLAAALFVWTLGRRFLRTRSTARQA
jgi:hypothetical protein